MIKFNTKKLISFSNVTKQASALKSNNKTIVFTNGCFDILHAGHVHYLAEAKKLGHYLWIGLNSDKSVSSLKGPTRPVNPQLARAFVLAGLAAVDFITIFPESTPIQLIKSIEPNVHVKGGDYKKESLIEYPIIKAYGGTVVIQPFVDGFSTTGLLDKLQSS